MNKTNFNKATEVLKGGKSAGFHGGAKVFDMVGAFARAGVVVNSVENEK